MTAADSYYEKTLDLLKELRAQETESIKAASEICASSISRGGLVLLSGSGHSRMMCEEMTPRQGCFPGFVSPVLLPSHHVVGKSSVGEQLERFYEAYRPSLRHLYD
jgi:uncharacterized phosphosugar-binding protein